MEEPTNRVFHSRGEPSREDKRGGIKYEIDYRSQIHSTRQNPNDRSGSRPWFELPPLDMPSDEFLNDYIPRNLDTNVTWRNVLACGMIPEQRSNKHIRDDIQYDNIQIQYPEAPSPEPEPEPSLIVEAHEIKAISCTKENDSIEIVYIDEEKYIKKISKNDELWKNEYSRFFQNDFNKFYNILDKCFLDKNFYIKWNIKDKTNNNVILQIYCEDDLFGFKVDISIEREENRIDILEKKVKELEEKENKHYDTIMDLQNKVNSLCEIINMMGPSFMRNICRDEEKHANYGAIGKKINVLGTGLVPIDPTDYIDQLSLNSKTSPTGGVWVSNNGLMEIISENGHPPKPDGLSWSQAAWNVVKSQKKFNL
tara:strand:+ start:404 stop:1504 length:1101 start_codon:yes stop_codon:yes gene_type:complete